MKTSRSILVTVLLAAGLTLGLWYAFHLLFAGGDVYPAFSTLRYDPAGASVLLESLARLPGVTAGRSYQPTEQLTETGATVFQLGVYPADFARMPARSLRQLEKLASRGNRVVIGMVSELEGDVEPNEALEWLWEVRFGRGLADEDETTPYFEEAKGWTVIDQSGDQALIIERNFGKGSIVLAANGQIFTNRFLAAGARSALIARIIGPNRRILFDETHFGIAESGSVVGLARRYRLHGLALGLAIWVALFIWRNASSFPPVATAPKSAGIAGLNSVAGLTQLLSRHIPPAGLVQACWQEWLKTKAHELQPERKSRVEAVIRGEKSDKPEACLHAMREIRDILQSKGAN